MKRVVRKNFSKFSEVLGLPNLIEVQKSSFRAFLQKDVPHDRRKPEGLQAVFEEVFPIESRDGIISLQFVSYSVGEPRYSPEECQRRGRDYTSALRVKIRLIVKEKSASGKLSVKERKEQEVFFGEIPIMTENGTFMINGAERVVVSQLHRSPGVSFGEKLYADRKLYSGRITPYRGAWLEFDFDAHGVLHVSIDRKRKMPCTVLLRVLGYDSDEQIIALFHDIEEIPLGKRAMGKIIAREVNDKNGLLIAGVKEKISEDHIAKLKRHGITKVTVMRIAEGMPSVIPTLAKDIIKSREEALLDIYQRLRPGDQCNLENAEAFLKRLFFDGRYYNLGQVGRFKINRKFGLDIPLSKKVLTRDDIVETVRYLLKLNRGEGTADDIDHLGNRRVRSVGELIQEQFRIGVARMERAISDRFSMQDIESAQPHHFINSRIVIATVKDFFARSQLSQFMDQTNPLAELTHKRRLSALGPGGLSRERAGFEVRDVHFSHYGRICPIETPEGPNIGLIVSLSTYARINKYGFIETPYRKVIKGSKATDKIEFLSADIEDEHVIAQANARLGDDGRFLDQSVLARFRDGFPRVSPDKIEYMDVSPNQLVSVAASLIPFLEHDDANRALMGCNMQRQAVPLLCTEAPLVGTGMEYTAAYDSGAVVVAKSGGTVINCSSDCICIEENNGTVYEYSLKNFIRSNQSTCLNQKPIVYVGDRIKNGEVIADGPATKNGELALGRNILTAFMPWRGYNFEDAILISEKVVKEDMYTSIHIDEFTHEARDTKLGPEEITIDIPNVAEGALANLDEGGIVRIGAEVKPGDILVGKISPKSETELTPEEKLLRAIFGEKAADVRDESKTAPSGVDGIVVDVKVFSRKDGESEKDLRKISRIRVNYELEIKKLDELKNKKLLQFLKGRVLTEDFINGDTGKVLLACGKKITAANFRKLQKYDLRDINVDGDGIKKKIEQVLDDSELKAGEFSREEDRGVEKIKRGDELPPGVIKLVKVYIATKRKISAGDKMAGRHGNKGVIARILPEEDMPFLPDGTSVELVLNPLGVPSRMNVGQILETHLGWAARTLGFSVESHVFNGASEEEIRKCLGEAGLSENGKTILCDGITGEPFDQEVTVGYIYMMKLCHLVGDKVHARSIGPYSLVTQQPLGGKANFGGQRFGEMEVWALEAYGAAYTLQELLTVKSDDVEGRTRIYEAIVKGDSDFHSGIPESFNVLVKELQGLGLDIRLEKKKSRAAGSVLPSGGNFSGFDSIGINIASPELVKSWSKGEVKKPETINYRTFKPEKDGLFCERIFGPQHDWECSCGKYKRVKHKGVVCDRCGVEVTQSKVRRERMGHIPMAVPVVHIWFFKVMPSRIGNLLDISMRSLERIIYYEDYIVVDAGDTPLLYKQVLSDEEFRKYREIYGDRFKAMIGAEALKVLLKNLDLKALSEHLHEEMKNSSSKQKLSKLGKRLRIIETFRGSGNKPEWMVMDVIPVIPADLRPLVHLDGGRFATSDLNDLYRRLINRNERLRHLISISAPDIIIRNEKRMLQESVDALFDNGRRMRPVMGHGNRPLKSLSDMLRGKQGRFRQNLLGKRVDYSGRSVIVVGPELKLDQCGIPKKMALELFEPFIIKELKERGFVNTIRSAKKMVETISVKVWDILDDVIKEHPVLLNRAPTLHRLGIQAFQPVLTEGNAIRIHPLVCSAFNADFDGDQMAVHVPLSMEAQLESKILMMPSGNIFSAASGKPIVVPTQDIVLGCCYLTKCRKGNPHEGKKFSDSGEVLLAYSLGRISLHTCIKVRVRGELIETTVGRVIFNEVMPARLPFFNDTVNKSKIERIISLCYKNFGRSETVCLLDALKHIGFEEATRGGISICMDDMEIPPEKGGIIDEAYASVKEVNKQYRKGVITERERFNKVIDVWTHATEKVSDVLFERLSSVDKGFNPIHMMSDSGARGSSLQIRQLAGMRGLMAKPSGEIIESPITASFREGLKVLEYFISSHGGRKGLADTALKTADSGYLTRRLVDVSQDVIVTVRDCGTINGITVSGVFEGEDIVVSLGERIVGRVCLEDVVIPGLGEVIAKAGEVIDEEKAFLIEESGIDTVRVRSVLTCEEKHGICSKCYGWNLASKKLAEQGEAVGIIAAQSIGEPGTQLTMRTFHIGGTASRIVEKSKITARYGGVLRYHGLRTVVNRDGKVIVLNRNGSVAIHDEEGKEVERYHIPVGANIMVGNGDKIEKRKVFVHWDPYTVSIFTEAAGRIGFEDIIKNLTAREELDEVTGHKRLVITEHKGEKHPQIVIRDGNDNILAYYSIPTGAHIAVGDGEEVEAGDLLAKTPRQIMGTKDITGGLPRVAELFEARRPKDHAIITEIDGTVEFAGMVRGMRKIIVKNEIGKQAEYLIPPGKHLNVYRGDRVTAGQPLIDGPVVLDDILMIKGERALQEYLLNEVQEVYRLQGVVIDDKHIEVIIRQMFKKVLIEDRGDTRFLIGEHVDRFAYQEENEKVMADGGKPASMVPALLGITKAALATESFISAASFQETRRVLADAAASGKKDELRGLKENVIMGHLIPAGTGVMVYNDIKIEAAGTEGAEEQTGKSRGKDKGEK